MILDYSESVGKVPPGIYAEYGFVMYEQGNNQQAIIYFQKEADKWPESRAFMTKMIANTNNRGAKKKEFYQTTTNPQADSDKTEIVKPSIIPQVDPIKTVPPPTPSLEVSK